MIRLVLFDIDGTLVHTGGAGVKAFAKVFETEFNARDGFEKLNISVIPAVFVFGPDGKEVKRFTMDDPNNQFTYDQVEKAVVALLDGKQ